MAFFWFFSRQSGSKECYILHFRLQNSNLNFQIFALTSQKIVHLNFRMLFFEFQMMDFFIKYGFHVFPINFWSCAVAKNSNFFERGGFLASFSARSEEPARFEF